MYTKTFTIAAGLMAICPALADFQVYYGTENNAVDPGNPTVYNDAYFFNRDPDCADVDHAKASYMTFDGDASHGGSACDGCDISKAPKDWKVTRFEVNNANSNIFTGDNLHLTAYINESDGSYGLYDPDMNSVGTCQKGTNSFDCPGWSHKGGSEILICTSEVSIKDSN